jgi:hypothetical protein
VTCRLVTVGKGEGHAIPGRFRDPRLVGSRNSLCFLLACTVLIAPLAFAALPIAVSAAPIGAYIAGRTLSDPADTASDFFGGIMTMSGAGGTLAVGVSGAGVVYLYARGNGGFPSAPTQTLTDPGANPVTDAFGNAVAMSDDGTTLLVGAPTAPGGGIAYLYTKVGGSFPALPTQTFADPAATLGDLFGKGVAVGGGGTYLVLGAPGTNSSQGAAYFYNGVASASPTSSPKSAAAPSPIRRSVTFPDPPVSLIIDSLGILKDEYGELVNIPSGSQPIGVSPTGKIFVRAPGTSGHPGKVFVIDVDSDGYTATDVTPTVNGQSPGVYFQGPGLAASGDGNTLVVGSPISSGFKGVAFVSMMINGSYTVTQTLANPGTSGDQFGYAAAMSADGNTLLVGARGTSSQPGAAYLYTKVNGSFPTTPSQTFTDPAHTNFDLFGAAVAVSSDGTSLVIGASGANNGKGVVYTFALAPTPNPLPSLLPPGPPAPGGPPIALPPARPSAGNNGVPIPLPPPRP